MQKEIKRCLFPVRRAKPINPAMTPTQTKVVLEDVHPLAHSLHARTKAVRVTLAVDRVDRDKLLQLRKALEQHPGQCPVALELAARGWAVSLSDTGMSVEPTESLCLAPWCPLKSLVAISTRTP